MRKVDFIRIRMTITIWPKMTRICIVLPEILFMFSKIVDFPGKFSFVSWCSLLPCNFMPSFGKIICLVFKKSSRQTDEQMADSGHGSIYRTNLLYPWWVQKKQEVIFLLLVISQGIPKIIFLALKVTGGLGGQGYEKIPLSSCKRKPWRHGIA